MRAFVTFLLPLAASASIWPDNFGTFHRTASQPVEIQDRALWDEYGLRQAEQAQYASAPRKFPAIAYRLQDSTDALAAFEWQRPAGAKPSSLGTLVAQTPDEVMLAHGNYLLVFKGYQPAIGEITALYQNLPGLEQSPLP